MALAAKRLGGGEAGGPGADEADRKAELATRQRRLDPAFGEGGLGDVFLDRADGHRFEALLDDAIALAEPVLGTDPAADLGHGVGAGGELVGLLDAALGGPLEPSRGVG